MIDGITELPFGTPGKIFRSRMPFSSYDPDGEILEAFAQEGISVVVVLTGHEECRQRTGRDLMGLYRDRGFEVMHLPIIDYSIPAKAALQKTIAAALEQARSGKHMVIHCFAGQGRTGLFMACLAKSVFGFSGTEAAAWTRKYIPGAVETVTQLELVEAF